MYWESNHARFGGAIFVSDYNPLGYCTQRDTSTTKEECFFQLPGQNLSNGIDAQLVFKDNSADLAGSVLYGGTIDDCKITGLEPYSSGEVFDMLVHIKNDNTNSSISSDPFHICPCENNYPDCSKSGKSYTVYPGETFNVSVVAVGQRNGIVPTTVKGHYQDDGTLTYLRSPQYLQPTFNSCTTLNYTVFSLMSYVELGLYADGPCSIFSNELDLELVLYSICPVGFHLSIIKKIMCL